MKSLLNLMVRIMRPKMKPLSKWEASENARAKNENAKFREYLEQQARA